MHYWHIQLDKPWGRGEKEIDPYKMLRNKPPIIGVGEWDSQQCEKFKQQCSIGDIVMVRKGKEPLALCRVVSDSFTHAKLTQTFQHHNFREVEVIDYWDGDETLTLTQGTFSILYEENSPSWFFVDKWYKKVLGEMKMKNALELLLANKNIILTGSPGTGKTYMAKQIAENIVGNNLTEQRRPVDILKNAIKEFVPNIKLREERDKLLKAFLESYPLDKINSLTLDQYCTGKGDRNNFCWWVETGLKSLGKYSPGSARSFLIYWSKEKDDYSKHGYIKDEQVDNQALKIVVSDIQRILQGKTIDGSDNNIGNSLLLKLFYTYYPDEYFPVNSVKHMDNIIGLFNIKCKNQLILEKNKAIYGFYKNECKNKDITPFEFGDILYNSFNIAEGEMLSNEKILLEGDIAFVQFHPSYDYTDFVEGLRPKKKSDQNDIGFELKNGIFKSFCKKAKNNPNKKYVFIIDEINRGEFSKIFGELFYSIDPGYRGENGKVKTQYSNIQNEETHFTDIDDDYFYVPDNLYLIGTMNDIDRSVESFDFAARRRFAWVEIQSKDRISMWDGKIDDWKQDARMKMESLNRAIENIEGLSSAYHIGPAYFLNLILYQGSFEKLWDNHIELLIKEYLRGMPDAKEKFDTLRIAYFNPEVTNENI